MTKETYLTELKSMIGELRVDSSVPVFPDGLINRIWDDAYYSGLSKAAQIAKAHKGSAAKRRPKPRYEEVELRWAIKDEERGEDIASDLIFKAIMDEMKGLI